MFSLISEIKRIWIGFTCVSLFHYKISILFLRFFLLIFASNFLLRFTWVIFASKRNKAKRNSSIFFRFFFVFFALNFSLRFDTGFRPNANIFNTQALNNFAAHKCTVRICTCIFTEIGTKESNLKTFLVLPSYSCERKGRNSNIYVFGL